jgi:hypothetical protein
MHADAIAACVHAAFDQLPQKLKPRGGEWVPLSGIVAATSGAPARP